MPGEESLKENDVIETDTDVTAILNQEASKIIEVIATITRQSRPVTEVTLRFLYRGAFIDYRYNFKKKIEILEILIIRSGRDLAILKSKS